MTTQQFGLKNISCSSCVMHLEGLEDTLEGIEKVDVNFKKQTMKIDYNPKTVTTAQIVSAVIKMGYDAWPVEMQPKKGSSWYRLFR